MGDEPPPKPPKPASSPTAAGTTTPTPSTTLPPIIRVVVKDGLKRVYPLGVEPESAAATPPRAGSVRCLRVAYAEDQRASNGDVFTSFRIEVGLADGRVVAASHLSLIHI